ncbi:DMT family transporter [Solicola gregarius]|uniref:DMT family transporter n=1 Tax=Solicola gregarius TaxID=2908642 RepID=A0AA46YL77_9ACTN|nr:DMT family transporter [Solicola gregarius]UYM04603.1 DMT family transporter [Solicola gregarius]
MSTLPLVLVLVGAVTHATWNIAAKRASDAGSAFVGAYTILSAAFVLPAGAIWLVADPARPAWSWLWSGCLSAAFHLGYGLLLQKSYAVGDLNVAYPVSRAVGPLLTIIVAAGLLGEQISGVALAGALVTIIGVGVIAWPLGDGRVARNDVALGAVFGAMTGCFIAGYTLWDDHSVNALEVPPLPYYIVTGTVQAIVLSPLLVRKRAALAVTLRRHYRSAIVVAALVPFSYVIVLVAMQLAPVSLVAALRATSIALASVAGWLLFREPHPRQRIAGAAIVVCGVAAIALG